MSWSEIAEIQKHSAGVTKWDVISDAEKESLRNTPFQSTCSGCDLWLETEADFARHFILFEVRYKNLGYCPVQGK